MEMMLWNAALSVILAAVTWFANTTWRELHRQNILLNRTREEMAKEYVTKAEVHADINRVMDRLDALDAKLDRFLENRSAGK
jgi:archaellum component FlaC